MTKRAQWLWLVLLVLAADQASKYLIESVIRQDSIRVLIPGLLNLVHTHNPGVAFGLFADSQSPWVASLLVLFSAMVMIFLIWLLAAGHAGARLAQTGMALILGGAAGNVLDRLVHHSVTDFIDFHVAGYHWPAFNVADSAIVIGAGFVLIELFRDWRHPSEERAR
jgi:signal peptidase II